MGRGKVGTGKEKKWGKEKSRAKQECFSRVPPNGEERSGSWPISERQISEFVSCVLTPSSKRGSFVRHIALLFHRKCKALFLDNLFFFNRKCATKLRDTEKNLSRSSEEPAQRKIYADRTNRSTVCKSRVLLLIRGPKDRSLFSSCS